jgi:RNA polymerase sigma-70 factor (ECF subfamily)
LRDEWKADGKVERFDELKGFLTTGKGEVNHAEVAARLRMEEGALRVAAHRVRKRYRQLLRGEIAKTLVDDTMVDEEMTVLLGAFS